MLLLAAALAAQATPYQGQIAKRLAMPPTFVLMSAKAPADLELCVADNLTVLGTPSVFRSGPNALVIGAASPGGNNYMAVASLTGAEQGTTVELRIQGKGWDDRLRDRITACL